MIDIQSFILDYVNNFSYLGIFFLMIIIALIPVPEEIVLLLIGYFAGYGFAKLWIVILASIFGILIGDNILFFLSRHGSCYINSLKNKIAPKKFARYERNMKEHVGKTLFLVRFIIGLRFLGPLIAGSTGIKWKIFQFYDLLAVLILVPVFVYLGYHFNTILSLVLKRVIFVKNFVFLFLLIIFSIGIFLFVREKFFKNNNIQK